MPLNNEATPDLELIGGEESSPVGVGSPVIAAGS